MTRGSLTIAMLEAAELEWGALSPEAKQSFGAWLDDVTCSRCGGIFACKDCGLTQVPQQSSMSLYLVLHAMFTRGKLAAQREALRGSQPPSSPTLQRALNGRITPHDPDEIDTIPPPPRGDGEEE